MCDNRPIWDYGVTHMSSAPNSSNGSALNLSEKGTIAVAQPELVQQYLYPIGQELSDKIIKTRETVISMIQSHGSSVRENPFLSIAGPEFITCPLQAKACSNWLNLISVKNKVTNKRAFDSLREKHLPNFFENILSDEMEKFDRRNLSITMRANLTKLRYSKTPDSKLATVESFEITNGLPICRSLSCESAEKVPLVGELSDTLTPQYLSDSFCLAIVNTSLIESQSHRELVSGVSYAVGFHTSDCKEFSNWQFEYHKFKSETALQSILASAQPHHFLSVTKSGQVSIIGTIGNNDTFVVVKFDKDGCVSDGELLYTEIDLILEVLCRSGTNTKILVDLSLITRENYIAKLLLLNYLLLNNADVSRRILGVMVNSGDTYISRPEDEFDEFYDALEFEPADEFDFELSSGNISMDDIRNLSAENLKFNNLAEELSSASLTMRSDNTIEMKSFQTFGAGLKSKFELYREKLFGLRATVDTNSNLNYDTKFENVFFANEIIREIDELVARRAGCLAET